MIALFRQLILSITAAALFGAVMLTMTEQKSQRSVLQLAVGLLLLLAIINPLRRLKLPEIFPLPSGSSGNVTQNQQDLYAEAVASSFQEQTQAYLDKKLQEIGVDAAVQLEISGGEELAVRGASVVCREECTQSQEQKIKQLLQEELDVRKEVISIRSESN